MGYYSSVITTMTNNTSGGQTILNSNSIVTYNYALFNKIIPTTLETDNYVSSGINIVPAYLGIRLSTAKVVKRVSIWASNYGFPRDFLIQGSNNGTSWTTIRTITNNPYRTLGTKADFDLSNNTAYLYYRLAQLTTGIGSSPATNWDSNGNTGANRMEFVEIDMFEFVPAYHNLIKHDGLYKYYSGGRWNSLGSVVTAQDYENFGNPDLSVIPLSAWSLLEGDIEISHWTDNSNATTSTIEVTAYHSPIMELTNPSVVLYSQDPTPKTITVGAIPKPRSVIPLHNHDIIGTLNNFSLEHNINNKSKLRILVSNNNGSSWKSHTGNYWIDVDLNDDTEVETFGLTPIALNNLNSEQWSELGDGASLRFAYYFNQHSIGDNLSIQTLSINESLALFTPILNYLTVSYKKIDEEYSGLMFLDESETFYSTSIGELIKYLDMGNLIAGQTSLDVKVKLANTLPFTIEDLTISVDENIPNAEIQLSYSDLPFVSEQVLTFNDPLEFGNMVEFYVRVSTNNLAAGGGNFEIVAQANPVV